MGVRTAAARLGFRFAAATSNKKFCSNSLLARRSIASSVTSTKIREKKNEKSFNLFLCFNERKLSGDKLNTNIVFRQIRLDGYDGDKEVELLERATHRFPFCNLQLSDNDCYDCEDDYDTDEEAEKLRREMACRTRITCLGSEILFTVGQTTPRDICWVDPLNHPLKLHFSSQTETKIKSFSTTKLDMRWGVIDEKLYCIDNSSCGHPFEVFDPKIDQNWQPLSRPPFLRNNEGTDKYNIIFLNESKKVMGWNEDVRNGVYCFDATKPDNGWIESVRNLGDSVLFTGQNDNRLVIHDNHPKLGDFNLMFSYDRYEEPFLISPFFISEKCDSFRSISEPIRLRKHLCSKYRVDYWDRHKTHRRYLTRKEMDFQSFDSQFVHLGSQRFCLILHKFKESEVHDDYRSKGKILVATFEYDVIVSNDTNESDPPIQIKTCMLGTHCFRYYLKHHSARQSDMIGAFSF